jgi:hypothetical protein
MLRKMIVAIAAAATLGVIALASTTASARPGWGGHATFRGGGGWYGGGWGWRGGPRFYGYGGPRFYGYGGPNYAYGYTCWRWIPTAWGPRRVWVC